MLQWGPRSHERGNASRFRLLADIRVRLQWGRVLMNAETTYRISGNRLDGGASMGPRSHERENNNADSRLPTGVRSFNGAAFS